MIIGFDLISDLNLKVGDNFNWENKATSLYCVIAGNISTDLKVVSDVLNHLSRFYQGVFYTPGYLEFKDVDDYEKRIIDILRITKKIRNVALLHHHVAIIDGIAVLGCTGYYGDESNYDYESIHKKNRFEDLVYLKNSIERLQKHLDVKKILIITNSVPNHKLYFGELPDPSNILPELSMTLLVDLEKKITHWAYGSYGKIVDTTINDINYVSNPYTDQPYWAKRINIEI